MAWKAWHDLIFCIFCIFTSSAIPTPSLQPYSSPAPSRFHYSRSLRDSSKRPCPHPSLSELLFCTALPGHSDPPTLRSLTPSHETRAALGRSQASHRLESPPRSMIHPWRIFCRQPVALRDDPWFVSDDWELLL
ncbi:hypothetical protein EDB80DRAFT_676910 [Ilyonectria destructans]|nr:hypothetical protein EDB80DRAFT_676910 [Ilyonectria destructans]